MADDNVEIQLGIGEPENVPQLHMGAEPEENVPSVEIGANEPENVPQLTLGAEPEENVPAIELGVEVPETAYAKRAEAWAVGNVNGVPVSETDPAYHNNAKWYAAQGTVADVIDDTAGIGDDDKVWSADKLATILQIATVEETRAVIDEYEGVS